MIAIENCLPMPTTKRHTEKEVEFNEVVESSTIVKRIKSKYFLHRRYVKCPTEKPSIKIK